MTMRFALFKTCYSSLFCCYWSRGNDKNVMTMMNYMLSSRNHHYNSMSGWNLNNKLNRYHNMIRSDDSEVEDDSVSIKNNSVVVTGRSTCSSSNSTQRCTRTRYTIDDSVCPPVEYEVLHKVVRRHIESLEVYTKHKKIARHTKEAFDIVQEFVSSLSSTNEHLKDRIILDSGCGTARSTVLLAEKYPDCIVIGVDRSMARLNRNVVYRQSNGRSRNDDEDTLDNDVIAQSILNKPNVLVVRAELADFWRCAMEAEWKLFKHYILYPNPYPKNARLKNRWHGHPSFPIILKLGGDITLRSNWKGYLDQFSGAVTIADEILSHSSNDNYALKYTTSASIGPKFLVPEGVALTNFEQKYFDCGEHIYELILQENDR